MSAHTMGALLIFFFSCIDGPISLPIKALTKFEMYTLCKEVRRETRSRSPWYSVNSASPDGYPDDQETSPTSTPSLFQYNVDALCIKPMDEFRAYAQYSLLWYQQIFLKHTNHSNRRRPLYVHGGLIGYFGIIALNLYIKMQTPVKENY